MFSLALHLGNYPLECLIQPCHSSFSLQTVFLDQCFWTKSFWRMLANVKQGTWVGFPLKLQSAIAISVQNDYLFFIANVLVRFYVCFSMVTAKIIMSECVDSFFSALVLKNKNCVLTSIVFKTILISKKTQNSFSSAVNSMPKQHVGYKTLMVVYCKPICSLKKVVTGSFRLNN